MSNHDQSPILVDYVLSGDRDPGAVAARRSTLQSVTILHDGLLSHCTPDEARALLSQLQDRPRAYNDAVLGLTVESYHAIPLGSTFDDLRITHHLLQGFFSRIFASLRPEDRPRPPRRPDNLEHSTERIQAIQQLLPKARQQIAAEGLSHVYRDIELAVVPVTVQMIASGIKLDRQVLNSLELHFGAQRESCEGQAREHVSDWFDIDNDRDIADYICAHVYCPLEFRRGVRELNDEVLRALALGHAGVRRLVRYHQARMAHEAARALTVSLGTNQRIYSSFDPLGVETGRYTSEAVSLLSLDPRFRQAVCADPGYVLMEAGYSQLEQRILAHFSRDPALLRAFAENGDLHVQTAALVLGIPENQVTAEQRVLGQNLDFHVALGHSPRRFAAIMRRRRSEARRLLAAYAAAYPAVKNWQRRVHAQARADRGVRTLCGRRHLLPNLRSRNLPKRAGARRQAVNSIIQGTAADLMKLALIQLPSALPRDVKIVLTVHDSVLLEVPESLVEQVRQQVIEIMETPPAGFTVPLRVDVSTGRTWAECGETTK